MRTTALRVSCSFVSNPWGSRSETIVAKEVEGRYLNAGRKIDGTGHTLTVLMRQNAFTSGEVRLFNSVGLPLESECLLGLARLSPWKARSSTHIWARKRLK